MVTLPQASMNMITGSKLSEVMHYAIKYIRINDHIYVRSPECFPDVSFTITRFPVLYIPYTGPLLDVSVLMVP